MNSLLYHVTPLFLLPDLLAGGVIKRGRDAHFRRASSREFDDLHELGLLGRTPSDHVLFFRAKQSNLLKDKLSGGVRDIKRWRAYPHVRLGLSIHGVLAASPEIFVSTGNIGRKKRAREDPGISPLTTPNEITAKVEEILIHAPRVSLDPLQEIVVFSKADRDLVAEHLQRTGVG